MQCKQAIWQILNKTACGVKYRNFHYTSCKYKQASADNAHILLMSIIYLHYKIGKLRVREETYLIYYVSSIMSEKKNYHMKDP